MKRKKTEKRRGEAVGGERIRADGGRGGEELS